MRHVPLNNPEPFVPQCSTTKPVPLACADGLIGRSTVKDQKHGPAIA
jgi:hypothetical protein